MKIFEGSSFTTDDAAGVGGVCGSRGGFVLRNGRNILLLLCGEVSLR